MKSIRTSSLGVGAALAVLSLPTAGGAQKVRAATAAARIDVSATAPNVVVAPFSQGVDSIRTILQRDFDFGNRLTPLALDASFFRSSAQSWLAPSGMPNYPLFAKMKVRALVIPRREAGGFRVAYHDIRSGRLMQDGFFPLADVPKHRAPVLRDSVLRAYALKDSATLAAIARTTLARDSLSAAMGEKPNRDRKKRAELRAQRDSLMARATAEGELLRAQLSRLPDERDASIQVLISRDSVSFDSLTYVRRMAIHSISDQVTFWITGQRGYARSRVVYVQSGKLRVVDSDGANDRVLTESGYALSPSWHPSGNRVVFSDFTNAGTQIAQVDVWSRQVSLVRSTPRGLNMTPAYTPNGHQIVYSAGGEGPSDLVMANADSTFPARHLYPGARETSSPTFNPSGARLAYISPRIWQGRGESARYTPQIFTMNADGTGEVQLTPSTAGVRTYRTSPDWSPDGRRVAYMQQNGDFQLWTIGVDDRKMKKLTSVGENEDPSWSPDSRHLAFTSNRGGAKEIWVLDTQSGRYRQLTYRGGGARLAAWSRIINPVAAEPSHVPSTTFANRGQR